MFASAIKTTPVTNTPEFRHRAANCVIVTIAIISICVMVSCGVLIVREYALARNYTPTRCVVTNTTREQYLSCSYCSVKKGQKGKGTCTKSSFPCLQILVSYSHKQRKYQGVLHPDSIQAQGQYKQVSTPPRQHPDARPVQAGGYSTRTASRRKAGTSR